MFHENNIDFCGINQSIYIDKKLLENNILEIQIELKIYKGNNINK